MLTSGEGRKTKIGWNGQSEFYPFSKTAERVGPGRRLGSPGAWREPGPTPRGPPPEDQPTRAPAPGGCVRAGRAHPLLLGEGEGGACGRTRPLQRRAGGRGGCSASRGVTSGSGGERRAFGVTQSWVSRLCGVWPSARSELLGDG